MRPFFLVLWAIAAAQAPPPLPPLQSSPAPTIHVDSQNPSASDTNPGSQALPLKTIGRAAGIASGYPASASPIAVLVHPGIYREAVTVTKPMILTGEPGAEIRGSNIWATGWSFKGGYWTRPGVPTFHTHGLCFDRTTNRCLWPEQVFFDGKPLLHVAGTPLSGQFAVNTDRTLILADNPQGHVIEVSVRTRWIAIKSDGVTISGFRMRHATNDSQTGAIDADSYSNINVEGNVLSDVHGAVVSLSHGSNLRIIGNDISRGGQEGIHMADAVDSIVESNRIHENNTQGFGFGWEAGGLKAGRAIRLTMDSNEVYGNDGPGLWCDGCQDVIFSTNRVHDNVHAGVHYEISHHARIFNNAIWKNGSYFSLNSNHWGWGAGILVQNSDSCEVFKNTLAWNSNGISVIEQSRGLTHDVFNTSIHDNIIVSEDPAAGGYVFALAWLSDYATKMFVPSQRNIGWSNKYGYSGVAELGRWRFAWGHGYSHLDDFNNTPGGRQGAYLTRDEQNSALSATQIPLSP